MWRKFGERNEPQPRRLPNGNWRQDAAGGWAPGAYGEETMAIEDIVNYMYISDRIASSGQPKERQFKDIAEAGFDAVINLAMPHSENAIPEEASVVTMHRMRYFHIPVPFDAPDTGHLKMFMEIMRGLSAQKVWIHCAVNKRVSAFLYQYQRLIHGASHEEALKVMLPTWQPDDVWVRFMGLCIE